MKKTFVLIAAAAMLAVSCQKETPATGSSDNTTTPAVSGKLTATFVKTKVSYTETPEMGLQPAWEVGDEIIGFDDAGDTYTLTVASVSAETATLSGRVPDGALHLIYKSGANASDISAKTLAIDYTAQKGDKTMPAVMLADGTVEDGGCEFTFTNAGAIIGISALKGVPSGSDIVKFTIEGENLSSATVALSGSALALNATAKAGDAISTATLSGITVTDANGTLSSPVYIAVPVGAEIKKVSTAIQAREPETMKKPGATPQEGVDYVTIGGVKWAKWNVGANSQYDLGWYFAWAGTEGHVWKNGQFVSASGVDTYSYTLSSAKTSDANGYLYVKTQSLTTVGFSFNWANTPFNNGGLGYNDSYFRSVMDTVCPKSILAPDYDAAHVNWGGSWRMPTPDELWALYSATYWAWDSTDMGYYVFSPDASHSARTRVNSIPGDLSKTDALLFFPGTYVELSFSGALYWSNTLTYGNNNGYDPSSAYALYFLDGYVGPNHYINRCADASVRAVLD